MQLFRALSLLLLPFGAVSAKGAAPDTFQQFHTKALASAPLKLDDTTFAQLTTLPRNHSVVVLMTALEARFGCQVCRETQPEWEILARSWTKGDKIGDSRLVFGTLDFNDGKGTFQSLGLQTAPVLFLYEATTGPHAVANTGPLRYDFTGPQTANQLHAWISRQLPDRPHPPIKRPINYVLYIASTTAFLGAASFMTVAWPYVAPLMNNRNLWAAVSLILILLFTSGHMFNHIRKVPYVAGDGRGGVSYFAGGFSNQFGMETQIIAAIYAFLSFAIITLALRVPRVSDPRAQQVAVLIWSGVVFLLYGFLLSVFRIKNGGYPFWLPPFA